MAPALHDKLELHGVLSQVACWVQCSRLLPLQVKVPGTHVEQSPLPGLQVAPAQLLVAVSQSVRSALHGRGEPVAQSNWPGLHAGKMHVAGFAAATWAFARSTLQSAELAQISTSSQDC